MRGSTFEHQRPPFSLEQLRTFLAVAEYQHVTRAAESLGLTQGAITQQVRLLEEALGVRLLERIGRGVRLTDAGQTVARACLAAARGVEGVTEAARLAAAGEVGSVHLGASATAASHYVHTPLAAFVAERPHVALQVTVASTGEVCELVSLGVVDVGVVEDPLPALPGEGRQGGGRSAGRLVRRKLADDEVVLVGRPDHPLAGGKRLRPADLAGHRFLAREEGSALDAVARQMLGPAFGLVSRIELGALDAVRTGALAGLGFAVLPRVAVAAELAEDRLQVFDFPTHRRSIHAVRRRAEGAPTAEEFWAILTGQRATPRSLPQSR